MLFNAKLVDCLFSIILSSIYIALIPEPARALEVFQCKYKTVCLNDNACSQRYLKIEVFIDKDRGDIKSPGQNFPVLIIEKNDAGTMTVVSEDINGSIAFMTIFPNLSSRLTFHVDRPNPLSMTNFGKCSVNKNE